MSVAAPDLPDLVGRQEPTIRHVPSYVASSGPEVVELTAQAGLVLDPWQRLVINDALGEREDGKWAAYEVALLVARQNGKGGIFEARALGGLFLLDERLIMYSAHEFKALDVGTPILTPSGWTTMGELVDGDEVFAPDGQPTKVVAAHPVRTGRPCYRLRFDDGQEVVADAEHLWGVEEVEGGRRIPRVLTTQQMVDRGVSTIQKRTGRDRRTYRFRVALPAPLAAPDADLPVDPWLFGAWLGDGTSAKGELTVGIDDLPYVLGRLDALGETYRVREDRRTNGRVHTVVIDGLKARLRAAGVLGEKKVPACYFTASERQRRDLLAGVMDTDGTVSGHQVAVTMSKRELMEDVASLVRSLGYKASLREFRAALGGCDAGPMWRVQWSASQDISPFQMPRKSTKVRPRQARVTRSQYNAIVAVEPVESRPTRCITVAHESSMYLVGCGFVPTHNTAAEMFRRIEELIAGTGSMRRRVKRVTRSHGEEGIELVTGQRLRFVARSTGSGRGFSGDCNIWDEAQHLSDASVDALMPTMSARPNPQLLYGGTAPDKELAPCDQIARVRRRALTGDDPSLAYFEWSADVCTDLCNASCEEHDDPGDPAVWAKTNPGLGIRISVEHVAREHASMSARGFGRERLSVGNYPSDAADEWGVIPEQVWRALADPDSEAEGRVAFGIDATPGGTHAAVAVAGVRADGLGHSEVVDHRPGTSWVVDRAVALQERWGPVGVVVDPGGPAGFVIPELEAAGVTVITTRTRDVAQGTGSLIAATGMAEGDEPTFRHRPHPALDAAVAGAGTRPLGDGVAWSRRNTSVDISPLVAVTLARLGLVMAEEDEEEVEPWAMFG